MARRIDWDNYFLEIAEAVKIKSPDIHLKVGCVLVSKINNRIVSTGYNGLVSGSNDDINWNDRELIRKYVIHAEANCLVYAEKINEPCKLYITITPCKECIKLIASYNIKEIYYRDEYKDFSSTLNVCEFYNIKLINVKKFTTN
jgi:dCMP deaminase